MSLAARGARKAGFVAILMALSGCFGGSKLALLSDTELDDQGELGVSAQPEPAVGTALLASVLREAAAARPEAAPETPRSAVRRGLSLSLGRKPDTPAGIDTPDVNASDLLPFGKVGRVCNIARDRLGREIDRHAGISLWDPFPNSTAMRPHYVTGLKDNCARSFTAALAMLGDPSVHEMQRYASQTRYDEADEAYETLKAQVCGAQRGTPCASMARLQQQVVMISTYDGFGESPATATLLLHRGTLVHAGRRAR